MTMTRRSQCFFATILAAALALGAGCGGAEQPAPAHPPHPHASPHGHMHMHGGAPGPSGVDAELAEVARVHGAAGPWAVAGYRMGKHALGKLGLDRQSFDLEIVHKSPRSVQFSCIADGASAATGASLGKLNLSLTEAAEADVETVYRNKSTGQAIRLRPSASFRARFRDLPREKLMAAGREVMSLPDAEVFEEVPAEAPPSR
jgi:formylmethanofuran dehydrogenase subunit E